ncbi:MmcQ/YjbR family DNA-binding protein [Actinokineospora enzanensis]|uniref:MmcQ/YjbR family DNA-binding protein n=1 Tax=Actinokineospora enzanensis TaxID=155975 RepID=UPI000524DC30|nr:MmcQ/YjbR family DNA-binding protein [Actinokineospora enzanensis]
MGLPEVTERVSHGAPAWFVRDKKMFVMWVGFHHGNSREAFWCAAPVGVQEEMVGEDPERFFRPPYVGHRGWLGVYLDGEVDWTEVGEIVRDAYRVVAPRKLAAEM